MSRRALAPLRTEKTETRPNFRIAMGSLNWSRICRTHSRSQRPVHSRLCATAGRPSSDPVPEPAPPTSTAPAWVSLKDRQCARTARVGLRQKECSDRTVFDSRSMCAAERRYAFLRLRAGWLVRICFLRSSYHAPLWHHEASLEPALSCPISHSA